MFVTMHHFVFSAVALVVAASSAPMNGRRRINLLADEGALGWLCHFAGPADPSVNLSVDLPQMIGGLCAKVNNDYEGCENFPSQPTTAHHAPSHHNQHPGAGSKHSKHHAQHQHVHHAPQKEPEQPVLPVLTHSFENSNEIGSGEPIPPTQVDSHVDHVPHPEGTPDALSTLPNSSANLPQADSSIDHIPKPEDTPNPDVGSDVDAGADVPLRAKSPDESHEGDSPNLSSLPQAAAASPDNSKPIEQVPEPTPELPAETPLPKENEHGSNVCDEDSQFSSKLEICVPKQFFTSPEGNSECKNGELDVVIKLCLDISTLGLHEKLDDSSLRLSEKLDLSVFGSSQKKSDGRVSELADQPPKNSSTCPSDQIYSSLVSGCVDRKFFSVPLLGQRCPDGWKFETALGSCLNLLSCQCQPKQ